MSEENKWREFWIKTDNKILPSNRNHSVVDREQIEELVGHNPGETVDEYKSQHLHVIEHEAYETVVSSNKLQRMTMDELRRQLEASQARVKERENIRQHLLSECRNHKETQARLEVEMIDNSKLTEQLEKLKAQNKILREALENYTDLHHAPKLEEALADADKVGGV